MEKNITINLILLSLLTMLTACGGSDSKGKVTTTPLQCTSSAYYDSYDRKWYVSANDDRECEPLTQPTTNGSGNLNCPYGQVAVRVPSNGGQVGSGGQNCITHNGQQYCRQGANYYQSGGGQYHGNNGYNNNNYNQNFHTNPNSYTHTCVNQNDRFVVGTGSYYYYNVYGSYNYTRTYNMSPDDALKAGLITIVGAALIHSLVN